MALTTGQFIYPTGRLKPDMFPGDDLTAVVAAWIADASARTNLETAQEAWVYYRAADSVVDRLMLNPATQASDDVRETMSEAQLAYWLGERNRQLMAFNQLTGAGQLVVDASRDEDD